MQGLGFPDSFDSLCCVVGAVTTLATSEETRMAYPCLKQTYWQLLDLAGDDLVLTDNLSQNKCESQLCVHL